MLRPTRENRPDPPVVVEIKSVLRFEDVFTAQMSTYLRLTRLRVGLIINFNKRLLRDGIKRVVF
jgi:GxxExxY protein